jgi:hypothetical protein
MRTFFPLAQAGVGGLSGLLGLRQGCRENDPMLHAVSSKAHARRREDEQTGLLEEKRRRLLTLIKERSFLTEGGPFKLASGAMSDYYLDMKPTTFSPEGLSLIADIVYDIIRNDDSVDGIGGLELGALPITNAVSMRSFAQGEERPRHRQEDRRQLSPQLERRPA